MVAVAIWMQVILPAFAVDLDLEEELFYDELELVALIVSAEAENQSFRGKQLVADVILNRVDDPRFPDTITGVIEAPGQFTTYANGAYAKVDPSPETFLAVSSQVFGERLNTEIVFFRSSSSWNWEFKEGDHYFQ